MRVQFIVKDFYNSLQLYINIYLCNNVGNTYCFVSINKLILPKSVNCCTQQKQQQQLLYLELS